ncbi:glycosyltransferase family 39 protein, partial [bacterium]|nr:glycosyltransferase family 39 protein [bacterium]
MSRGIGIVLLLSGALKLLLAIAFADLPPRYDEVEFLEFGRRIAAGDAPVLWRAPGYQSFVAGGLTIAGGNVAGVRLLQVLLSVATTLVLYRLARRVTSERAALAAAAFVAFYPSLVAFSHLL